MENSEQQQAAYQHDIEGIDALNFAHGTSHTVNINKLVCNTYDTGRGQKRKASPHRRAPNNPPPPEPPNVSPQSTTGPPNSGDITADLMFEIGQAYMKAAGRFKNVTNADVPQYASGQTTAPPTMNTPGSSDDEMDIDKHLEPVVAAVLNGNFETYLTKLKQLINLAKTLKPSPIAVVNKANSLLSQDEKLKAVVTFHMVSKVALQLPRVSVFIVNHVQHAVAGMVNCILAFDKDKPQYCKTVVVPAIKDAISDLMLKMKVDDNKERMLNVAWCYKALGSGLHTLKMYKEAAEEMNKGIDILKREYGDNAYKKKIYGLLISSTGSAYHKQKMYNMALDYFELAQISIETSEVGSWRNRREKDESIKCNQGWLKDCQADVKGAHREGEIVVMKDEMSRLAEILKSAAKRAEFPNRLNELAEEAQKHDNGYGGKWMFSQGKQFYKDQKFYNAFVCFSLVSKCLMNNTEVLRANVVKVQHSVAKMNDICCKLMGEDRKVVEEYILPTMEDAIKDLYNMPGADFTFCLENIAWCHKCIGGVYSEMELHQKAIQEYEKGMDLMEQQDLIFGAEKCRIFGLLKSSMGNAFASLKNHRQAAKCFNEAKSLMLSSTDWRNEEEKQNCVKVNDHNARAAELQIKDVESLTFFPEFTRLLDTCVDDAHNDNLEMFKKHLIELTVVASTCCGDSAVQSVMKTGEEFHDLGQFTHSICTYLCLSHILSSKFVTDRNLDSLNLSLNGVEKAASSMISQESSLIKILKNTFIPMVKGSIENINLLEGVTDEKKIETKVWCFHHLSECYTTADLYDEAYNTAVAAIEIMKNKYPRDYQKYRVVSLMNVQLVKICELLGKNEEAKHFTSEAKKSLEKSTDWDGDTSNKRGAMDGLDALRNRMEEMNGGTNENCVIM